MRCRFCRKNYWSSWGVWRPVSEGYAVERSSKSQRRGVHVFKFELP
jgi:hypothetical protein